MFSHVHQLFEFAGLSFSEKQNARDIFGHSLTNTSNRHIHDCLKTYSGVNTPFNKHSAKLVVSA